MERIRTRLVIKDKFTTGDSKDGNFAIMSRAIVTVAKSI